MLSKVHFDGELIAFFDCTESSSKFFHRFSNFNQVCGAFLPNWLYFWNHIFFTYSRSNNSKDRCLLILEATDLFWCNVAAWFLSVNLERDYWYRTLHHLEWKSNLFVDISYIHVRCFEAFEFFIPLKKEILICDFVSS